ncbi:MAG: shikimate dehydrogenase [Chitinophagales bacterium]|nr:shikimate dehydrogenase [Chitinophagales bacterium]
MKVYGLIGKNIAHSFSPEYFRAKFEEENIDDAIYVLFPLKEVLQIKKLIADNPGISGLNVTIPFKTTVIEHVDFLDEAAERIGAVNCISIYNKKLYGNNTDAEAFARTLLPFTERISNALILGSGGAAKAIAYALEKMDKRYDVASRTPVNKEVAYSEIVLNRYQLVVNTTPLGMNPLVKEIPNLNLEDINKDHIVYDLNYNPTPTKLMEECEIRGATVKDGLEMLHTQADLSWEIWQNLS